MACDARMPHTLILVIWKKYTLTHCVWKAKCHGTRHLEGIHRGTRRPKSTCRGGRPPDATCLSLVIWKKYALTRSNWKAYAVGFVIW